MGQKSAHKKQKAITKKRHKQKIKGRKSQHQNTLIQFYGSEYLANLVSSARKFPLHEVNINSDWKEDGLANILIARRQPDKNLILGWFLVDIFCLGIKNTLCKPGISIAEYNHTIKQKTYEPKELCEVCPPELAHQIIYGAMDYASSLGFKPHKDFRIAKDILDPQDSIPVNDDLEFGKDGKPFYISGPHDNSERIIRHLKSTLGEDGFHFAVASDNPFKDEVLMDRLNINSNDYMPVSAIIEELSINGIEISAEKFCRQGKHERSVNLVVNEWLDNCEQEFSDEEVIAIYKHAKNLWKQLIPEIPYTEMFVEQIRQIDEQAEEEDKLFEKCDMMLDVWERLKSFMRETEMDDEERDETCHFYAKWLSNLGSDLLIVGKKDQSYYEKAIVFGNEITDVFPKTNCGLTRKIQANALLAYFALGRLDEGEKAFELLTKEFPDDPAIYAMRGTGYAMIPKDIRTSEHYRKCIELWKKANEHFDEDDDNDIAKTTRMGIVAAKIAEKMLDFEEKIV